MTQHTATADRTRVASADPAMLRAALDEHVDGEVRFDAGSRAAYAHDRSNYRQVPIGVVVPRNVDAAVAAVAVCHEAGVPILSRGGGTSLAGQCCNEAVVIDWTKYCRHLVSVEPGAKTAIVEPGAALDKVNDGLKPHGLMVGPRPSTHVSCTIGAPRSSRTGSPAAPRSRPVTSAARASTSLSSWRTCCLPPRRPGTIPNAHRFEH